MPLRIGSLCRLSLLAGMLVAGCALAQAQDQGQQVLTLDDALKLAKERNGTVRSAYLEVKASDQQVVQALAAYYPTIAAQYQYQSDREAFQSNSSSTFFLQTEGEQTFLNSNWTIFDSGERSFSLSQARHARASATFNARQVLRTTLFSVVQQYYDTLRAQELERVQQATVSRAHTILDQTQTRIKAGDAAKIEELQANADYQNALVSALTAKNQTTNAAATLKGTIGLSSSLPLPTLQRESSPVPPPPSESLDALIAEGLRNRPDLKSQRQSIVSEQYSEKLADRVAGVTFNLNLQYIEQMTPAALGDRALTFLVNVPIFDGGKLRAQARQISYQIKADTATFDQAERVVRADIEAAFVEYKTNSDRLQAAQIALDAAQKNYEAAVDSQKAGAYDLLQVLTAQVSLVTAESNQIQALYDYRISDINLRLVTGRPVPGE